MTLGEKLKAARLEAGLSQRQLCGDIITRNMLSQIENGTAKPSFATLQALCARLQKPVSQFVEGWSGDGLALLERAAGLPPKQSLKLLEDYSPSQPLPDSIHAFLTAQCCMALAEEAIGENRMGLAREYLHRAVLSGADTQVLLRRQLLLLQHQAGDAAPEALADRLPDNTAEQLLRAEAALSRSEPERCLAFLQGADRQTPALLLLRGKALLAMAEYPAAARCFAAVEETFPRQVYPLLEQCYRETGDFEKAYRYACKQR